MKEQLIAYIKSAIGVRLHLEAHQERYALYLETRYTIWSGELLGVLCVFYAPKERGLEPRNIVADGKRLRANGEPIFVDEHLTSYLKDQLVQSGIAFVVPGKQLYIPRLATILATRELPINPPKQIEYLKPSTQCLIIKILNFWKEVGGEQWLSMNMAAELTGYSNMTITRSFNELRDLGIVKTKGDGKGKSQRQFMLSKNKAQVWKQSEPYMRSPIIDKVIVRKRRRIGLLFSGITALAEQSDLASDYQRYLGVFAKDWPKLREEEEVQPYMAADSDVIEIWRYAPIKSTTNQNCVDPYSLWLIYQHDPDTRTQEAANNILEEALYD